jgi:putative transposase
MRKLDEQYLATPFYGVRRMTVWLEREGESVNEKRVRRLLRQMGIMAIYAPPRLSMGGSPACRYPYLLTGVTIDHVNQVWSTDITYLPMVKGFLYLVAVMDWYSRYVLAWELSNTLESGFCLTALERALQVGTPEIFNSDQGAQFTSPEYTKRLSAVPVRISWDGRGRAFDNIFIERLWRSVKYEYVYLHAAADGQEQWQGLNDYYTFYNDERPHQALNYQTPAEVYFNKN